MALKVDYKDDGFTGNRKYRQVNNADNTVSFEDVTAYNPAGDSFGALDINATNETINALETEMVSVKKSVSDGKTKVAAAITAKGQATANDAAYDVMATNIGKIETESVLSGNAAAGDVLAGKTFYNTNPKSKATGTMVNRGAVTQALNAGGSYTIPAGYHNGSGKVTANTLASQTSATATAAQILNGQTAWVNGNKITGTIASRGAATITPGTANQVISAGQYLSGAQTIKGDANLVAGNIRSGVSIFGKAGTMVDYSYLAAGQVAF